MKTIQNKIWMRFLALGIFSIIILIYSCKKAQYTQNGVFILNNQTPHFIKISYSDEIFEISPNGKLAINRIQSSSKRVNVDNYVDPIAQTRNEPFNKVIVNVGGKCLNTSKISENSIINIKNYISEKIDDRTYKFTYTFTEADYNRAVICP